MRIEQIGQILEIVECGSIGKAAQKLYMQQPNLSMAVKAVEEEFHQPIFYRTPNGVCLTPFGKDFLAFAEPYYKQYQPSYDDRALGIFRIMQKLFGSDGSSSYE